MVIRKLTASFGKLQGETLELQPGLNVISLEVDFLSNHSG